MTGQPAAKRAWPHCGNHPDMPLFWHPRDGWGWRCHKCHAEDAPTPQPFELIGPKGQERAAPITPGGRAKPDHPGTEPTLKAIREKEWAERVLDVAVARKAGR